MNLIVIVDQNWGIGKDGDQLVYLKPDLKRFQQLTTGHTIVLGRKTLATFPGGKPLKLRRNLILSTQKDFQVEGGEVVHTIEELLKVAPADSFVIGGASVYHQLLPYCHRAYVTKVEETYPADCSFPNLDADPAWQIEEEEGPFCYEDLRYSYVTYGNQK